MNRPLIVVGVNKSKIYSGYTFSTISHFEENPNLVKSFSWKSEKFCRLSLETPTSILLNAEKSFESFGYEAEDQYMSLTEEMKESNVYFFQHFLCQTKCYRKNGEMLVKPTNHFGPVPLKTLLSHSLSYLIKHFYLEVMNRFSPFKENYILWVIVYPDESEWVDVRFTFNEACVTAGISEENFVLVGESLAVKSFARHIEQPKTNEILPNCTVILNCALTQVSPNKALQIYLQVPTNLIGISSVIADIEPIMTKRLGCSMLIVLTDIISRCEFINELEVKLNNRPMNQCDSVKIRVLMFFLGHMRKHITNSRKEGFRLRSKFLFIDNTVIHEVFQSALEPLMNHFEREVNVLNRETILKVILVGDFSRYAMTKVVFQERFPQYEFIVPLNSYMSATIGATTAGHEIQSDESNRIVYVPKMSIVGTSHIEHEFLSTTSGAFDNSLSEKAAAKRSYQMQWSFENCYKTAGSAKSEEFLLQILHEVYDVCRTQAQPQINTIIQSFHPTVGIDDIETSLSSDVVKPLIEYRRKNALKYLPGLIKSFAETLPNKIDISNTQLSVCTSFIEKSMECCWLMCVTEPPMFLKFDWNNSEQIDLFQLEIEGGDGKYVDSMRWPTLYLHENGPLMNKGVVNAK
ncbi:uncharacterized protein LOC127722391 [Mytilus californianus]|uniref:uncharacterized protein LOC127722391 n=1 Tax=Mytilus californianus TaxID=6549 RepID=UPI0022478CF1|nr:uncharacterized protein LOC127722391 [Mytilus californianus]